MTDSGKQRPRRASSAGDSQPDGVDDTRSGRAGRARHGATDDIDSSFTRPPSSFQETVVPAPVLSGTERRTMPGSGVGRKARRWDGLNDETTPVDHGSGFETIVHVAIPPSSPPRAGPQRQVQQPVSSWDGWPEQQPSQPAAEPRQPRAAAYRSPARVAEPELEPDNSGQEEGFHRDYPGKPAAPTGWISHHRRMLTTWVVAAIMAAVLTADGVFIFSRFTGAAPVDSANPSTSGVDSEPVNLADTSLLDASDASLIEPAASWNITQTIKERGRGTLLRVSCLDSDPAGIDTTVTLQRAIGTRQGDKLALIHQIDAYANGETAKEICEQRVTSLASCSATPALITSSSAVTGLGDEVLQMSVAQEGISQYHTILLVRTGKVISLLDMARNNSAIDPQSAVNALQRPLTVTCETAAGTCPSTPAVTLATPPVTNSQDWLIPNDILIIAPEYLAWLGGTLKEVESSGTGCEGVNLTSEQGPTDRKQRSYTIGSPDDAFKVFGITQYRFALADEAIVTTFRDLLSENLASCGKRVAAAKVTELSPVSTDGNDGPTVTARLFDVKQQVSDDGTQWPHQVTVARSGMIVSYLLFTGVGESKFTEDQLKTLAVRVGQCTARG